MKRRTSIFRLAIGIAALLIAAGCTDAADPITYGELCLPATDDCPDQVELERPFVGRNVLEFTLEARSNDSSSAKVRVVTDGEHELPDDRDTEDGETILFPLPEDDRVYDEEFHTEQLDSYYLTVFRNLRLELICNGDDCDHRMEYLFLVDSLECVESDDCGRNQFCEVDYGRCAECVDGERCDRGRCDRETGFCTGEATGCSAASDGHETPSIWVAAALLALLVMGVRRRRRRAAALVSIFAATSILAASPSTAVAESGASMHIGGGVRVLTGDAGDLTHPGWGISVSHQLRWQRLGTSFELSTNSFGLREEAAIERGQLRGYGLSFAPQFYIPIPVEVATVDADHPLEAVVSFGYTRWSVAENRIARVTGLDLNYHGMGPTLGLRWHWNDLEISSTARYLHIFEWPGSLLSVDLTIGFSP